MLDTLRAPTFSKLFAAHVIALTGTGLLTVALALLAYDLAGSDAGLVLGIAFSIKMVAYVVIAPLITALTTTMSRKKLLVTADLIRAAVALSLPLITETWHIYILIFLLQAASATFTPTFQSLIPEVLPDQRQYTKALSLSRLAYDLEAMASPLLAAAMLTVLSYHHLFLGTAMGFALSAAFVLIAVLPAITPTAPPPFLTKLTEGVAVFIASTQLRALMAMNVAVAAATAMVLINTVAIVQHQFGRTQADVTIALAAYGCGSMLIALTLPRLLETLQDRTVMLTGAAALPLALLASAAAIAAPGWYALLGVWLILGAATSLILTPSARLLRRTSHHANRPAVFAAQFSLSHLCFLVTYPLAGILGARWGFASTAVILAVVAALGALAALWAWSEVVPKRTTEAAVV
ncbi:MFS transporter [Natronoglycomyces albus]|uniref:MFS transporter n=1 Tax=Natronoglycomyces albus TaxID=2811108 RepID=A0A895XJJ8_9ACTN|nr:MFS transporter [Natronoglycomyces albus]QSB05177.1 MFS transporter [Natronoglycomyces albus]